jgi:RHS repeat-associated protein
MHPGSKSRLSLLRVAPGFARTLLGACLGLLFVSVDAADKSGVSPNAISLPKGPGSIEGLGESFQPTLNTGTAKYGLPLKLPPGTAGHGPNLRLSYEGGGGNGVLGFGWNLGVPSVQRRTDKGIPLYGGLPDLGRADVFIDDSREELIRTAEGNYFCRNEGAFIRYRFKPQPAEDPPPGDFIGYWEGTQPDGTRMEFGTTSEGRVSDGGSRIFGWMLQRETDTRGNTVEYAYTKFPGEENLNQVYLATIRYGPGSPPWDNFHFVRLVYEDRTDGFEDCRAGFPVRTGKRLRSILVGTQGPTLPGHQQGDFDGDGKSDNLVRRYDLHYLPAPASETLGSLLVRVVPTGADGTSALPASEFEYTSCVPPSELAAEAAELDSIHTPPDLPNSGLSEWIDFNADGLPDLLTTEFGGGSHRVTLNGGETREGGRRRLQWNPTVDVGGEREAWGLNLALPAVHLSDMDGDGLADFVVNTGFEEPYYFRNSGKLAWDARRQHVLTPPFPPSAFAGSGVRTADLDFDKRPDLVQVLSVGEGFEYALWFNLGEGKYSAEMRVPHDHRFDLSSSSVEIVDLNGDRVPDLCRIEGPHLLLSSGIGYGHFLPPRQIPIPDFSPEAPFWRSVTSELLGQARLTDLSGDGLADLVIAGAPQGELWYWLNRGNLSFDEPRVITGLPRGGALRWADMNGNGTVDMIVLNRGEDLPIRIFDLGELLGCGSTPRLLTGISNGMGGVTKIEYAPSTRFLLRDAALGHPWIHPLPFPVTVVSSVSRSDSQGHAYLTRFEYHDGYYDASEKQFRGFERVEQIEVGDPTVPTLVTRSHFDVGQALQSMKGKLLRLTTESEDGRTFWDETTEWQNPPRLLHAGAAPGDEVRYAHPVGTTRTLRELGQGQGRRLETTFEFDNFGNQIRHADFGVVEDGNRSALDDERITRTDYAVNTNLWILRLPSRLELQDEHGTVLSRTEYFYDDPTFAGRNPGGVTVGNLTLKREWHEATRADAFVASARTRYDRFGNPVWILDPLAVTSEDRLDLGRGHARELAYDRRFRTFPLTETIHVGDGRPPLVFAADYDEGWGVVVSSTDFNGNRTSFGYDTFGRLTSITKPGDPHDWPTVEYAYALAVPDRGTNLVNYVETRQRDHEPDAPGDRRDHYFISREFSDGMGRKLMTRTEAEPAPGSTAPRVVVSGASLFNARQQQSRVLNPCFAITPAGSEAGKTTSATLDELLDFRSIEDPAWTGGFDHAGAPPASSLRAAPATSTEYDGLLRPIRIVHPDGSYRRTVIEPLLTREYDENDVDPDSPHSATPMVHAKDGLGRLVRVEEVTRLDDDGRPVPDLRSWITRYQYDLNDQLIQITDSQNNVKTFSYDGLKRKLFMNDPDRGTLSYSYDDASNLRETVDAKAQRVQYTYDGVNRLLTEDYLDAFNSTPDVAYHYDAPKADVPVGDGTLTTGNNTKGMLAWVKDLSGEEHTSYDARGRVESVIKRIPDPQFLSLSASEGAGRREVAVPLVSFRTGFAYDSLDRVTTLTYPDNDQIAYGYNARNLPRQILGGVNGLTQNGLVISNILYQPSDQWAQIDYGNGVRTTYGYDPRLRLSSLRTDSPQLAPNSQLIDFAYGFDGVSNIRSITDHRPTSAVPLGDPRRNTQVFAYDDLYRITRAAYNPIALDQSNATNSIAYRYDRIGNMLVQNSDIVHVEKGLSVTDLGNMSYGGAAGRSGRIGRAATNPPGPHALTGVANGNRAYPYDANGNMTRIDGLTNTWDFKDRLIAVESSEMRAEYTYDYTDRRIIKRVAKKKSPSAPGDEGRGEVESVLYPDRYFEVREHDAPTKYVWNGNTRVARVTGSLTTNQRVQRLRLWPGWNLVSLAVTATNALKQLADGTSVPGSLRAAFKWDVATNGWDTVTANATLPASTVLWVEMATNATLTVTGAYAEPADQTLRPGANFVAGWGLQPLKLADALPGTIAAWTYDASIRRWDMRLTGELKSLTNVPETFAPGYAVFVRPEVTSTLTVPDSALHIHYYHQDHLGSSSALTDTAGALVSETAHYAFGFARNEFHPRNLREAYGFTQKERDLESGLDYFEARYLSSMLGRFLAVDPLEQTSDTIGEAVQSAPGYGYCNGRPTVSIDPTGFFGVEIFGVAADAKKLESGLRDVSSASESWVDIATKNLNCRESGTQCKRPGESREELEQAGEKVNQVQSKLAKETVKTQYGLISKAGKIQQRALNGTLPGNPLKDSSSIAKKVGKDAAKDVVQTYIEERAIRAKQTGFYRLPGGGGTYYNAERGKFIPLPKGVDAAAAAAFFGEKPRN